MYVFLEEERGRERMHEVRNSLLTLTRFAPAGAGIPSDVRVLNALCYPLFCNSSSVRCEPASRCGSEGGREERGKVHTECKGSFRPGLEITTVLLYYKIYVYYGNSTLPVRSVQLFPTRSSRCI